MAKKKRKARSEQRPPLALAHSTRKYESAVQTKLPPFCVCVLFFSVVVRYLYTKRMHYAEKGRPYFFARKNIYLNKKKTMKKESLLALVGRGNAFLFINFIFFDRLNSIMVGWVNLMLNLAFYPYK